MRLVLKTITVSLILLFSVAATFAQNTTYVKYAMSGDGQVGEMLSSSTVELYFNPDNFKMEMDMMGGMIAMDMRMDLKKETGIMLMDMMGQQQYKVLDKDDTDEEEAPGKMPEIKYLNEYKTIAGDKCQKAVVQSDDMERPIVVYFAEDMAIPTSIQKYLDEMKMQGIKGFPLQYEVQDPENGKVVVKATEVANKRYPKNIFSTKVPDGYTEMDENGANMVPGLMGK